MDYSLGFSVSNLGPKRFQKILNEFDDLEKGWNGTRAEFERLEIVGKTFDKFDEFRKAFDYVQYTGQMRKSEVAFISFLDSRYPQSLKKIENPPIGLFCKGNLELLRENEIASHAFAMTGSGYSGEAISGGATPESGSVESYDPGQTRMTDQISEGMDPRIREDDKNVLNKVIASSEDLRKDSSAGSGQADYFLKIAVVGTRKATEYGKDVTEFLVSELASNGVCIVSGLALGIDGIAHRTTVSQKGKAIAVLGCGVDCCLPSENFSLYSNILKNDGLIISEYPLSQPPNKGTFLARNRIIAALSDGVLVTEAAEGSGSLVTAEYGFSYNKKVFAVPGRINSQMAKGSLSLIKKGAVMVQEGEDILDEFSIFNSKFLIKSKIDNLKLSEDERKIVSLLQSEDLTIDEIVKKTKFPISKLFGLISRLELSGIVKNSGGKISILI